jgi:hypothetical protein
VKLAAMGNPGPLLSKNFQTTYQLDADCCTEFLDRLTRRK